MYRPKHCTGRVPYIPYRAILILCSFTLLGGILSHALFPRTEYVPVEAPELTAQLADAQLQLHAAEDALQTATLLAETATAELEGYKAQNARFTPLGEFNLTAYCSCSKCCGQWGESRPVVNGHPIVFTASGALAEQGVTIAVDPEVIPYGTKVYIEGVGVRVAQDTGGAIKGNRIDVYYDDHSEAWNSGVSDRPRQVWIINEEE